MERTISQKTLREFGLLLAFAFPFLIGWLFPYLRGYSFRSWTLLISLPSLILTISRPKLLFYPYKAWMKLGHILGWFNSRIILGIVYLLILLPIALIMKIFGHDPLRIKKVSVNSYRVTKLNHTVNLRKIF